MSLLRLDVWLEVGLMITFFRRMGKVTGGKKMQQLLTSGRLPYRGGNVLISTIWHSKMMWLTP